MSTVDMKYLLDGRIVRVLAHLAPHRIVVEIGHTYEDDEDGELFFDGTEIVDRVYDKAPVEAVSREVRDLEARRAQLSDAVAQLECGERTARKRVDALKVYSQLERVEDFLAGKITHYVTWSSYGDYPAPFVSAVQDERCGDSRNKSDPLKLLVLYGTDRKTVEWKLNYYSDGSGNNQRHCVPCCSLEEANTKAREILARSFEKHAEMRGGSHFAEQLVKAAKACGAPIPAGFEARIREAAIQSIHGQIEKCDQQRKELVERLRGLHADAEAPQVERA